MKLTNTEDLVSLQKHMKEEGKHEKQLLLLMNGFYGGLAAILLVFAPQHYQQCLLPWICIDPPTGIGAKVLKAAPEIQCDIRVEQ
jgi:hypothetical protein